MNRSILIVICDFLLVSLLVFSTVDIDKIANPGAQREMNVSIAPSPDKGQQQDLGNVMRQALAGGDVDALLDFRARAPGMPWAHPTVEHMAPLFVTLGAAEAADGPVETAVDGFFMGLRRRSFQLA